MPFKIGENFTQRHHTWTTFSSIQKAKLFQVQYDDDGKVYTIWGYDGPEVHIATIWKGLVPSGILVTYAQAQNDLDKTDFEANYKASSNQSIDGRTRAGSTASPIPTIGVLSADGGLLKVGINANKFPSTATATVRQEKSTGPTSAQSFSVVMDASTLQGTTAIVVLIKDSTLNNLPYTLTDNQNNAYTRAAQTKVSSTRQIDFWYANIVSGGPLTVTASGFSSSGIAALQVYEVTGLLRYGNPIDKIATAQNTGTSHTVGPTTTSFANEFCLIVYATEGSATISPGAGWTNDFSGASLGVCFSQVQTAAGSLSSLATSSSSITTIGVMITFSPIASSLPLISDEQGKLIVKAEIQLPPPPTGGVQKTIAADTPLDITASHDTSYTITNGKTFHIQQVVAGAEGDPNEKGSKVEVYYDDNGTLHLIERLYVSGFTEFGDYPDTAMTRDGTSLIGNGADKRILIRRERLGGAALEIDAVVRGYEI